MGALWVTLNMYENIPNCENMKLFKYGWTNQVHLQPGNEIFENRKWNFENPEVKFSIFGNHILS